LSEKKELIGILLLNLGGPDSLHAIRPFLYNLLSDREIIRLGPSFMQKPLAWLISTMRASKSRQMYRFIGGKSPILDITLAQAKALEKALNSSQLTVDSRLYFKVYVGMRYWHPFIKDTINEILRDGIKHLVVLSLYPHYSKATTGSAISEFKRQLQVLSSQFSVKYIKHWYDFPPYIDALSEKIYEGISGFRAQEFVILYSAHSLPRSFIKEGDPYLEHIKKTIEEINKRLSAEPYEIKGLRWYLSFQSKGGYGKWLEPSTDETIVRLANEGCKNLLIVPISFVSDHIETLYEIGVYFRDIAVKHNMSLKRCESLNTSEKFINALKELVMKEMH
jgi:ferrochelatase